jgi:hypothetical protein
MKRISLRFPRWSRIFFTAIFLTSLASGLMWFALDRWGQTEGEFGPEKHPWLAFLPKIHGASAFAALISFGMIYSSHLPAGWRAGWSRKSGILMLADTALIILTAWGLYYVGSDETRALLIWLHLSVGSLFPLTLFLHLRYRKVGARPTSEEAQDRIVAGEPLAAEHRLQG